VSKGKKHEAKNMWWWNEDVQRAIKEECYKSWHHDRSTSNMVMYKEPKKNPRRAVRQGGGPMASYMRD
jgi:hypothetical protein